MKERYIREYGEQYIINSPNGDKLMKLFHKKCERNGIVHNNDKIFEYLNAFEDKSMGEQLNLWGLQE